MKIREWIRKLFNREKEFIVLPCEETKEILDDVLEPGWWIRPGSKWVLQDKNDPFEPREHAVATVLEVKKGWVRYKYDFLRESSLDERHTASQFLYMFKPLEERKKMNLEQRSKRQMVMSAISALYDAYEAEGMIPTPNEIHIAVKHWIEDGKLVTKAVNVMQTDGTGVYQPRQDLMQDPYNLCSGCGVTIFRSQTLCNVCYENGKEDNARSQNGQSN